MTQAFNLSQLANNLNTAGQLDATDGLVNAVPVANGGTGATTAAAARTNLGLVIGTNVPSPTGTGASGSWAIAITGNAATATSISGTTTASIPTTALGTGTASSTTFLAGDRTFQSVTPTTAQVLAATAAAAVGAVGSYAFCRYVVPALTTINEGSTIAGSSLNYGSVSSIGTSASTTSPSGTWRLMGYMDNTNSCSTLSRYSLFLRIS